MSKTSSSQHVEELLKELVHKSETINNEASTKFQHEYGGELTKGQSVNLAKLRTLYQQYFDLRLEWNRVKMAKISTSKLDALIDLGKHFKELVDKLNKLFTDNNSVAMVKKLAGSIKDFSAKTCTEIEQKIKFLNQKITESSKGK